MAAAAPVELLNASSVGMVGILHPVVPLAERTGGIARRLEHVSHRHLVEIHSLAACGRGVNTRAGVVPTGEKLGPGR